MKKSRFLSLLAIPFLLSCNKVPEYDGIKIQLNYAENGGLVEITPDILYERAITFKKDEVVLFTVNGCSHCLEAKEQVNSYAVASHIIIHQINISNIDLENGDYDTIVATTTYLDKLYEFPPIEEASFPTMYMFKKQGVAMVKNSNFVDNLRMYVDVING